MIKNVDFILSAEGGLWEVSDNGVTEAELYFEISYIRNSLKVLQKWTKGTASKSY